MDDPGSERGAADARGTRRPHASGARGTHGDAADPAPSAGGPAAGDAGDPGGPPPGGGATTVAELGLPMPELEEAAAIELLRHGELRIAGRLVVSSNNALLGTVRGRGPGAGSDLEAACVYKPVAGERPLVDFPDGTLARREVAAWIVSRASGWGIVPPTVLRDGPWGEGMVQLWMRGDDEVDPVALVNAADRRLRPIAVFDAAVNNTDRKAGHLVPAPGGRVFGVDHGVTFSPVPKLRTVLWHWRGDPLTDEEGAILRGLRVGLDGGLGADLRELLAPLELRATARRIDRLLAAGVLPSPDPRRPAIPWPPV